MSLCNVNCIENSCQTGINEGLHKTGKVFPGCLFVEHARRNTHPDKLRCTKFPNLCIKLTCYCYNVKNFASAHETDLFFIEFVFFFVSAQQSVGPFAAMRKKLHQTQLSFRRLTVPGTPKAHR